MNNPSAKAQLVFEDWVSNRGTQDIYVTGKAVTDPSGNVYQAGASLNDQGNYDAIITKYNSKGDEIWTKTFDDSTSGDDIFVDIVYSNSKIYATGVSRNASESASQVLTVRLSASNGNSDWERYYTYFGSIFNVGVALTLGEFDTVYIAGTSSTLNTLTDALVLKYSATGTFQWAKKEDISVGGQDGAVKINYKNNVVRVIGGTQDGSNTWRYLALSYNYSGTLLYTYIGSGNGTDFDKPVDMVIDSQDNIYITGFTETTGKGYDMYTVKLDDDLNVQWNKSYNFSGSGDDKAFGMCLDNSDNVIVTGYSELSTGNTQYTTVKYSNSGTQLWAKGYDISTSGDTAKVVSADAVGNIYVAGTFFNGSNQDIKTIKYDSSGNQVWEIDYNGIYNGDDYILDMTHNGDSPVVVAQTSTGSGFEYSTIKYIELDYDTPQYPGNVSASSNAFIKNLGQLRDENGTAVSTVKYLSKAGSYAGFYKNDGFECMTRSFHNDTTVNDTVQKVSLTFNNPKSGLKVRAFGRSEYFENYYFPYSPNKLERVPFYEKLYYNEVWQGISMETGFKSGQEYSFTVTTKGQTRDIGLTIAGADSIVKTTGGDILLYTFNRAIRLPHLRAYQKNGSGILSEFSWSPAYNIVGNVLRIDSVGAYNTQKDLILRLGGDGDPITQTDGFCHSTYFGGSDAEYAYDSHITNDGGFIICGKLYHPDFYPSNAVLQVITLGGFAAFNAFVAKFDENFVPQFMSVVVAVDGMEFYAVATKNNGDIYAGGMTNGTMVTANQVGAIYQDATFNYLDDYYDGVIVLLNGGDGTLKYSTYFGGTEGDGVNAMAVDSQDRLYVVGTVADTEGFPITSLSGAYNHNPQDVIYGDGFLARFSSDLNLDWNTIIGGDYIDVVFAVTIGNDDKVGIAGATASSNLDIDAISGTVQDLVKSDLTDYFLMTFNANGQRTWSTFESNGLDNNPQAAFQGIKGKHTLAFDGSDALYFSGNLRNLTDVDLIDPGSGAFYVEDNNGNARYTFLVKYSQGNYQPVWRTQLMDGDGDGNKNTVNSLIIHDSKLYVGGTASDPTLNLVSASPSLYSEPRAAILPGQTSYSIQSGFFAIFDRNTFHLLHSTYYGGSSDIFHETVLSTLCVNDNNKLFGFGFTSHYYDETNPDYYGIPVKNNNVPNAYYQDNIAALVDIFGFSFCYDGTPLNIDDIITSDNHMKIRLFPNPISSTELNNLSIECEVPIDIISLYDSKGVLLYSKRANRELNKLDLGSHSLASGLYFIVLSSETMSLSKKLVVLE